jgi:RNA polymerase sigma factor (sigma-70 family)
MRDHNKWRGGEYELFQKDRKWVWFMAINEIAKEVARSQNLSESERESYFVYVANHILDTDFEPLRRFEGRAKVLSYLRTYCRSRLVDFLRSSGRSTNAPSTIALRLGFWALRLERYIRYWDSADLALKQLWQDVQGTKEKFFWENRRPLSLTEIQSSYFPQLNTLEEVLEKWLQQLQQQIPAKVQKANQNTGPTHQPPPYWWPGGEREILLVCNKLPPKNTTEEREIPLPPDELQQKHFSEEEETGDPSSSSPEEILLQAEEEQLLLKGERFLWQWIEKLPERDKQIITASLREVPVRDIASKLKLSEKKVYKRKNKLEQQLRKALSEWYSRTCSPQGERDSL